ncbi:MAG: mechanosensitive ion channel family protein, partial [Candidatus Hydrogenedentes bacterium]|nr:mechanosensitive ion channel family protein [Candidatus Hydrogenedentota bacterium]
NAFTIDVDSISDDPEGTDEAVQLDPENEENTVIIHHNDDEGEDSLWTFSQRQFEEKAEELQVVAEEAAEEKAEEIDASADPRLATPRRTMQTFLDALTVPDAWDSGGRENAIDTFDLSDVPENVREARGEDMAILLKKILDRDRIVVLQEIPDETDATTYIHLRDPNDPRRKIEIAPVSVGEEGAETTIFKFSQVTLESLQPLWDDIYRDRETVSGVVEEVPRVFRQELRDWIAGNYPFLVREDLLLENWQWLGLLVIVLLGMIVSRIAAFFLLILVRRFFRREDFQLDTKLEIGFVRPIRIAIMAWVWWIAMRPLGLDSDVLSKMKTGVATLSAAAAVWAIYRLVDILGTYVAALALKTENKYDDMVVPLIVRSLKVFVVAVGIIFVIQMAGNDTTKLLAGLGIGGLAFALAAKDTIGNLFGSLTLLFDRPFRIGDSVQIGDVDGSIESVGMRSTRVRTFYNSVVTIPNSELTNTAIDNFGARQYRRFKTEIGIAYNTPPEKIDAFCEGIREFIRKHPFTRKDTYHVYLNSFGDSSLNILLYCFFENADYAIELRERHRLILDVIRLASRLGVEFAFPTQTLYVQAADGAPSAPAFASKDALAKGLSEAGGILDEFLDKDVLIPPPVSF